MVCKFDNGSARSRKTVVCTGSSQTRLSIMNYCNTLPELVIF